jgi:hypothetical protein
MEELMPDYEARVAELGLDVPHRRDRVRSDGRVVTFSASQVSTLDYFHPSLSGQAALARVTWAASWWSSV